MLPVIYVLGGIGLRFVSKKLLQRAIAMGAKKAPKGFKGKVVAGTPKQLSNLRTVRTRGGKGRMPSSSSNASNIKGKRANPAARPSTNSKTSTNKGAAAKPTKPLSKNSKTSDNKGAGAKPVKPGSKNSKTSTNKGAAAKPTKPLSKNSKTSTNKGSQAKPTKPPSKTSKTSTSKGSKANAAPKPSTTSKTSTNKGANAKPVKPLAKNSKTSNNKTSKANPAPKPSSTSKTSNSKGKGAKPTKPGSKTSKTSTSKGRQSNLPLIIGLGSGVAGTIMALGGKKKVKKGDVEVKPSPRARVSRTEIEKGKGINLKKPAAGPVSDESFGAAFKRNRKAKKATFTFKDKLYTTRLKEESIAEHKKKFGVKGKYK